MEKFVPRSRVRIFLNERTRSTSLDPKLMFWYVSYYLGAFGAVWLPYETRCEIGRTSAKVRARKSRWNFSQRTHPIHPIEVASEFFSTNAPDPPHWTLNWRFGAFQTIWVNSGLFGFIPKLGAKRAELVQMFVPRSRVRIFRNERTRSTPWDPKLMFWCVFYYLVALQNSVQNGPN